MISALELNGLHVGRKVAVFSTANGGAYSLVRGGILTAIVHDEDEVNLYIDHGLVRDDNQNNMYLALVEVFS